MASGMTVKVEGLAELERKLKSLPKELVSKSGANQLAQALRDGGKPMMKQAKSLAARSKKPYKVHTSRGVFTVPPGRLKDSIQLVRLRKPIKGATESFVLKPLSRAIRKKYGVGVNYWHLIEFGMPGRGIAARPFLRPAYEANKTDAVQVFARSLGKRLDKIARKLATKK